MSVIRFSAAETQRQHIDATFQAPSAAQRVFDMQIQESAQVEAVADYLAKAVGDELTQMPARERAACRFLACHAIRSLDQHWTDAAHQTAVEAVQAWMRSEGGSTFRDCPDRLLKALAVHLVSVTTTAYFGVTEGSRAISPGEYLRITESR